VQRGRYQGVALALDLADELVDLAPVQQQLAGAHGIGGHVAGGRDQRGDLGAEQEQLAVADHRVGLADVGAAGADGLQLPALQRKAGLEAVLQVVLMARALVQRDGAAAFCLILACLLAHGGNCPRCGVALTCPRSNAAPWSGIPRCGCSDWSTTWRPIRAGSHGATTPGCWSAGSRGWWRSWSSGSVRSGPGSPPRTPCIRHTGSTWPCATARSGACRGGGCSTPWTSPPAGCSWCSISSRSRSCCWRR